ncbi:hypothetical protein [Siccirubricoccus sp. G192]|uniref:hypothetical protein n=1 Tax=Siccirubricoccus sp. G192 TaxID=2849651 RepID=UPI001C2CA132|nr:hypothetical protein [Siccirubricoccus sp. G192]MBV1799428.1 hypothetical protein [Siccirubricoccus sp. G192]
MARKRRAIIHIGTAKTGSTSIQRMLAANRAVLLHHGFAYPASPGEKNHFRLAIYAGSSAQVDKMARVTGEAGDAAWVAERLEADLAAEMAALPESVHTVIFSNEHCYRKVDTPAAARRLKALLAPHFDRFTVIAYLRRQDELAVSLYSTRMRSGSSDTDLLPPLEGRRRNAQRFDWALMLDRWAEAFGPEAVAPRRFLREAFPGGDLLRDFQAACGMDGLLDIAGEAVRNPSLNAAAQEFLRRLNAATRGGEAEEGDEKVPEFIRHVVDSRFGGPGRRPSRAEAEAFCAAFRDSNERLRATWFPALDQVFPADFSRYPEAADPLPAEAEVLEVAMAVIRHQAAMQPGQVAEAAFRRAQERVASGDPAGARRLFHKVLGKEPAHAGALRALLELGRTDPAIAGEAAARLRRALAAEAGNPMLQELAAGLE